MDSSSERIGLARAIHDGIAQDLVALRFRIEHLAESRTITPQDSYELKKISLEISQLTEKVRKELFNLRQPETGDFLTTFEALIAPYRRKILIHFSASFEAIPPKFINLFLDITPELIRNTLNHAGASRIDIAIAQIENSLRFTFIDDGRGGAHEESTRYGLTGIRESVELCGGTFALNENHGTQICLNLPIAESFS